MKFNCDQQTLSRALGTVSKAITQRTTIPVLKGILLSATNDNKLKLTASNLDLSIERTIDVNVEREGSIVISDSKFFMDLIRKLPNEPVNIEVTENENILIKTLNTEVKCVSQSADEFPGINDVDEVKAQLSFDREILNDMIRKTQFCASIDETKGVIVGVLIELEEDSMNMVALDGFRMAVTREQMRNERKEKIIISAKIMNELSKILSETNEEKDENVSFILSDKRAVMLLEGTKVVMRLLEGDFINYKEILPKEKSTTVKINRETMIEAIERASLLAKEGRNNLIRITVTENLMNITSASEEGAVKEDIIMEKSGENLEIGFNSKYIMDALKAIDDDEVLIEMTSAVKPCLIKPIEGNGYEYLILPVRIPSN